MANEFKHADVGVGLTKAEWEATSTHIADGQVSGDTIRFDGVNWIRNNILKITSTGALSNNNYILEGYSTGRNVLRAIHLQVKPGTTPGTHIDVNENSSSGYGFNVPTITNATDLTAGSTSGSFKLNATGTILSLDITEDIIGIICASIVTHDINSSSTTEMYVVHPRIVTATQLNLYILKRGSPNAVDWRAIMDVGDDCSLDVAFVTSS